MYFVHICMYTSTDSLKRTKITYKTISVDSTDTFNEEKSFFRLHFAGGHGARFRGCSQSLLRRHRDECTIKGNV